MINVLGEVDWDSGQRVARTAAAEQPAHSVQRRDARVFPPIIISADDQRLVIRAEVPGMRLDDFRLTVSGDLLTIHGTRQTGQGLDGGWYHRRERESGDFSRSVRLPANVDGEQADASYQAGVLSITLPLVQPAKPQHVPVKVAGQ